MYPGHQRNLGINRQGNGMSNNHNHHQPGSGKNRPVGNNGGGGSNNPRYSGNHSKIGSSNNSGNIHNSNSSPNGNINGNTNGNNNQSPITPGSGSGSNVKSKGHSDLNWKQYCQEWHQYVFKGRLHGRESNNTSNNSNHVHSNNNSSGPSDCSPINQNAGLRNDGAPVMDKQSVSINQSGLGPVKSDGIGVTHKDNYQTIDGDNKKINAAGDCDSNSMVKPFTHYPNSSRFNSRGNNWSNRGGRGGAKSRGYNNNNRGGGSRNIIQYHPTPPSGYYSAAPIPNGGLGLPMDTIGPYNFIPVAATPFQLSPYVCCDPNCQECPQPVCYSTANGMLAQYYTLPSFQYVPVSLGAPGMQPALPPPGVATANGPPPPLTPPGVSASQPPSLPSLGVATATGPPQQMPPPGLATATGPPPPTLAPGQGPHGSYDITPLNPNGKYLSHLGESDVISGTGPSVTMAATAPGIYSTFPAQIQLTERDPWN